MYSYEGKSIAKTKVAVDMGFNVHVHAPNPTASEVKTTNTLRFGFLGEYHDSLLLKAS